jgi:hypothetical protein
MERIPSSAILVARFVAVCGGRFVEDTGGC